MNPLNSVVLSLACYGNIRPEWYCVPNKILYIIYKTKGMTMIMLKIEITLPIILSISSPAGWLDRLMKQEGGGV